jgi:hypothetical protein
LQICSSEKFFSEPPNLSVFHACDFLFRRFFLKIFEKLVKTHRILNLSYKVKRVIREAEIRGDGERRSKEYSFSALPIAIYRLA